MTARGARHVAFVGAMGSGKTTIGRRVAAALGRPFVDNDEVLQRTEGESAADLAARDGIDALHRAEAKILLAALRASDDSVIAAAASTITSAEVRAELNRRAWVVWLRAAPQALVARLPESKTRPFAGEDPVRLVREQSERRDALFDAVADATFDTGNAGVDEVVTRVLASADERGLRVLGEDHRRAR